MSADYWQGAMRRIDAVREQKVEQVVIDLSPEELYVLLANAKARANELAQERDAARNDAKQLERELVKADARLSALGQQLTEKQAHWESCELRIAELRTEVEQWGETCAKALNERDTLREALRGSAKEALDVTTQASQLLQERDALRKENIRLLAELTANDYTMEQCVALNKLLASTREERDSYRASWEAARDRFLKAEEERDNYKGVAESLTVLVDSLRRL